MLSIYIILHIYLLPYKFQLLLPLMNSDLANLPLFKKNIPLNPFFLSQLSYFLSLILPFELSFGFDLLSCSDVNANNSFSIFFPISIFLGVGQLFFRFVIIESVL